MAVLAAAIVAAAANAQFVNPSFEDPALSPGGYTTNGINGWTADLSASPLVGVWYSNAFSGPPPDGNQIGYTNSGAVAQQSSVDLSVGQTDLTMFFGHRSDGVFGIGTWELWAGGSVANGSVTGGTLLDSVKVDESTLPIGTFQQFDASYTAAAGDPLIGQLLTARLTLTGGTQMDFDLVALSVKPTPEPASMTVLGLGALALLRRRKLR